ncbi:MAG: SAM-dependent methyltransferase [Francisellaceae bacterium]|jgi:SAM-dependent methyltransferase
MNNGIISHVSVDALNDSVVEKIKKRIVSDGDKPYAKVDEILSYLDQLCEVDFGRYLLINSGGWNGYWTNYFLTYPMRSNTDLCFKHKSDDEMTILEKHFLAKAPLVLATQQRFQIFLQENQKIVNKGGVFASLPSGLLGELLYLDYSEVKDFEIYSVDLDQKSLDFAKQNAEYLGLDQHVKFRNKDAWNLGYTDKFDLISSNGLNIYEPDENKVIDLYRNFYKALKDNGTLVISYLEPPIMLNKNSGMLMDKMNLEDLRVQMIVTIDILQSTWANFCTKDQMLSRLKHAGFSDFDIHYDLAHAFPTVVATKV